MDNETKKLLSLVDSMGEDNRALLEATMMLDAAPQGKRLRMIKNVNMHLLQRKFKDEREERELEGRQRAKKQKANPRVGKSDGLRLDED